MLENASNYPDSSSGFSRKSCFHLRIGGSRVRSASSDSSKAIQSPISNAELVFQTIGGRARTKDVLHGNATDCSNCKRGYQAKRILYQCVLRCVMLPKADDNAVDEPHR